MTATVLVTGGTGYVAGWCIAELLRRGYAVRATVRDPAKAPDVRSAVPRSIDASRLTFCTADLDRDDGWDAAAAGCDYVLHVASPLGADAPRDPQALIGPARDGTLRVLRAATRAGVRRVVMTSAATAATPPLRGAPSVSDESVWFDPAERDVGTYRLSKRAAERAARDFMRDHAGATSLATILPGAVFGPLLASRNLGSVQVIARLLQGRVPGSPRLGFEVVDVRDLADVHIRAMTSPDAGGERFLATGEFLWMADIAQTLRARLGSDARKVPTRTLPDFALRLMALFDPSLRAVTPNLGRMHRHTTEKARRVLGWSQRSAADTLVDCARSLIAHGAV